jgi:predicted RNA-binding protein
MISSSFWHDPDYFYRAGIHPLIMTAPRYWIIVASQEHVKLGIAGGFAQAGHGKRSGLARMHAGDRIVYYSPKIAYDKNEPLHAFTAIGEVADEKIVQAEMSPDFKPFRRKVTYHETRVVKIEPLINDLQFIRNKKSWGYAFCFGLLEIGQPDFERIEQAFEDAG